LNCRPDLFLEDDVRVELPGDQWAEIKGIDELKARDKIALQRVVTWVRQESDTDDAGIPLNAGLTVEMQMVLLSNCITSWSLEPPAPVTRPVLEDLPIATFNALCDAVEDHMKVVMAVPNRRTPSA
jgi:hypothetical protein